MIISKRKSNSSLFLSLILVTSVYFFNTEATNTQTSTKDKSSGIVDLKDQNKDSLKKSSSLTISEIDELLTKAKDQLNKIESTLERLVLVLNQKTIKLKTDEDYLKIKKSIINTKTMLKKLRSSASLHPSSEEISTIAHLNKAVINILEIAISNNLNEWPELNLENIITRSNININYESLNNILDKNENLLKNIIEDSYKVGLSWWNKSYKNICKKANKLYSNFTNKISGYEDLGKILLAITTYTGYKKLFNQDNKLESVLNYFNTDSSPKVVGGAILTSAILPHLIHETSTYFNNPIGNMLLFGGALRTYENNFLNLEDNNYKKSLILGSYISMLSRGESGDLIKYSKDALFKLHNKFQGIKNKSDLEHEKADYSIRFKDVIGYDDVKDKLRVLIDYMISPEKFDMARIAPERGYLFYGLPGSGKSFMAKALAGELKALSKNKNKEWFIKFTAKDYEKYGFASIMSYAKKHAPCILFIDEVDGLQLSRSKSGKPNTILSEMQSSMDGETESSPDKKVIILATTNKLESIDQSLKRPGRFGEKIPFNLPTREERTIFLEDHLEENGLYISEELQSKIIRETDNLSLAELNKILSSAKRTALATCKPVTEIDFVKALDSHHRLVSNDRNSNNKPVSNLSKKELKIVAAHQVGRALAILLLQKNKKLSLITTNAYYENVDENEDEVSRKLIEPKIKHGMTLEYSDYNSKFKTTAELEDNCQVELAGHIAQEILLNTCSFQYRPEDQENALNITQEILLSGESKETLSKEKFDHKLNLASELKDNLKVRVKALLLKNKENLSNLYNSLLSKGILRDNNIYKLIN